MEAFIGPENRLNSIDHIYFLINIADVGLHGIGADVQALGYGLVGKTSGYKAENLSFAEG